MKIKLEPWAFEPIRAHKTDAGLDLRTPIDFSIAGRSSEETTPELLLRSRKVTLVLLNPKADCFLNTILPPTEPLIAATPETSWSSLLTMGKKPCFSRQEKRLHSL